MIDYKKQLAAFLDKSEKMGSIKSRDKMAETVLDIIAEMYASDMTQLDELQVHAVKLLGAYSYLALKAAKKDTEADMAGATAEAARNGLINAFSSDPKVNVTQARGMADEDVLNDRMDARLRKQEADEYEVLASVAERAISLIQSVLRRAESERRASKFSQ